MKHNLIISAVLTLILLLVAAPAGAQTKQKVTPPGRYGEQVTSLFSQHRWDKGKEVLDEALDKYPKDPNLHYLAGRYWYHFKNFDRARYHLTKSCRYNYNHLDAKNLLVNVEELTGNYSSAICYVNELLEVNPYWKGLWLRKVELYKKQGNFEEANALLKRLRQIYPDDSTISGDWFEVLETTFQQARSRGDVEGAEEALSEMVRIYPNDPEYQLAYANALMQKGRREDALSSLYSAINTIPGNADLVRKAAGILQESGQTVAALALVRDQLAANPSPELRTIQSQLLEENARIEKESDPYQLFTKVYATRRSQESLDYLLKESYRRAYDDEALYYINEMRQRRGDSPGLCMMEYQTHSRMGHQEDARAALRHAEVSFPDSYDICLAGCRQRLHDASEAMDEELYAQAVEPLEYVRTHSPEPEFTAGAVRRLAVCYRELADFPKAEAMLSERMRLQPAASIIGDYASLLVKQGRREDALDTLYRAAVSAPDSTWRQSMCYAYEELAIPMIKDAMQEGLWPKAETLCDRLLDLNPANYWALRYACQSSDDPEKYIDAGLENYPNDVNFIIKKAKLIGREQPDHSLEMLGKVLESHPGDASLAGAFAEASRIKAEQLIRDREFDNAAAVLDTALLVRPLDDELRYTRGLVYEKQKQWDSAAVYQRHYVPSVLEEREYLQHMRSLRNRTYRNSVDVGYYFYRFAENIKINGIASIGYTRYTPKHASFGARFNYTARDLETDEDWLPYFSGSRGYQLQGFCTVPVNSRLEFAADASAGIRFFPFASINTSLKYTFPSDWELEAGLLGRQMQDTTTMLGATITPAVNLEHFYMAGKLTAGVFHDRFFANGALRGRFYPYEGARTYIEAQAGAGSAPELDFSNIYFSPYLYDRLNSFVSLGANWLLEDNLSLNVMGSWHTLYDQTKTVSYRNMFIGNVQLVMYF